MKKATLTAAMVLITGHAWAAPFNAFDPISMAMGGAGVAVDEAGMAPFFNPSTLAVPSDRDKFVGGLPAGKFSIGLSGGMRMYDPNDFIDSLDDFQDDPDIFDSNDNFRIDQGIAAFNDNPSADSLTRITDDTRALSDGLVSIGGRSLQMEGGGAFFLGIPNKRFGAAVVVDGWGAVGFEPNYRDNEALHQFADELDAYAACYEEPCTLQELEELYAESEYIDSEGNVDFDSNRLDSTVDARGIAVEEVGIALAREFATPVGPLAFGITPKSMTVYVFDYSAAFDEADTDDADSDENVAEYTDFSLDLGVAKQFASGWRTGVVVKNAMAGKYKTPRGHVVELNPQARLGVAHQTNWSRVAVDVDLTENDPVSFEGETRFVSVGAEVDTIGWAQLRAGYRSEMVNGNRDVVSVGVGLFSIVDIAVAASDNEFGFAGQVGFRW